MSLKLNRLPIAGQDVVIRRVKPKTATDQVDNIPAVTRSAPNERRPQASLPYGGTWRPIVSAAIIVAPIPRLTLPPSCHSRTRLRGFRRRNPRRQQTTCSHEAVIMKRPYRDVLVWLTTVQRPDNSFSTERAIAHVIALLEAYDGDQRLAARWEERFVNARTNNFPFGISPRYRNLLRAYFTE